MTTSRDKIKPEQDKMELDEESLSLQDLPIEIAYLVAEQAAPYNDETKVMATLAPTCKHFGDRQFGLFSPELEKRASNQLGKYIEDADLINVEKMVKANPRLLLRPIEKIVNPHTQQIIVGMTPVQAARCEGDDEMCLLFTGCHLALMAIDDAKNIKEDRLKEAREKRTPILIKKRDQFFIYGIPEGKENWQLTNIATKNVDFNELPFEKEIIFREDELFTPRLIEVLKKGHGQLMSYMELACESKEAAREEIRKQLDEKFGEGKEADKESEELRENGLAKIIQAITNEQFNSGRDAATNTWILSETMQQAITNFREEFAANQPTIIENGTRFRLELLKEVCEVYANAPSHWNNYYKKYILFEDAVFPIVLKYAAANDKQKFAQGLRYLQRGEKFRRSSMTRDKNNFSEVLRGQSPNFLLSGSCVDLVEGAVRGQRDWSVGEGWRDALQNLCRTKTSNLENICSHAGERKRYGV